MSYFVDTSHQNISHPRYKTYTKTIAISNRPNETISKIVFDFKQQLIQLLEDKNLMILSNLVLTNSPDKTPSFHKNDISEINESD